MAFARAEDQTSRYFQSLDGTCMDAYERWHLLAGRITNLRDAASLFLSALRIQSEDPYGVSSRLSEQARAIVAELELLLATYGHVLPSGAAGAIRVFLDRDKGKFTDTSLSGLQAIKLHVPLLVALRSEVDYHMGGFVARARSRTERAFLHLQRTIAVDDDARSKWEKAFETGEARCEQLGAVHLLQHGIWAFKVDARGARTDLVYGRPIEDTGEVVQAGATLVLTEWKRVKNTSQVIGVAASARTQAQLYALGALAGVELADPRYIVLVSSQHLELPGDTIQGGVTYRHLGIAVSPATPSKIA